MRTLSQKLPEIDAERAAVIQTCQRVLLYLLVHLLCKNQHDGYCHAALHPDHPIGEHLTDGSGRRQDYKIKQRAKPVLFCLAVRLFYPRKNLYARRDQIAPCHRPMEMDTAAACIKVLRVNAEHKAGQRRKQRQYADEYKGYCRKNYGLPVRNAEGNVHITEPCPAYADHALKIHQIAYYQQRSRAGKHFSVACGKYNVGNAHCRRAYNDPADGAAPGGRDAIRHVHIKSSAAEQQHAHDIYLKNVYH